MTKHIIINSTNEDTRIAILEGNKLVEVFVERPDNERMVGDIYKAQVKKVVPGMQAAFIDIGHEQDAFLHFSDFDSTNPEMFLEEDDEYDDDEKESTPVKKRMTDEEIAQFLRKNKELIVQIVKEPISNKGPRVSMDIAIPGRFLVLVPNENRVGISKKISNRDERRRLRDIARKILPKNYGLIVRTVAEGKKEKDIKQDLQKLLKTWRQVEQKIKNSPSPMLIYKDMSMASSVIRDLFTHDVERVVVDSRKLYRDIISYLKDTAPGLEKRVEYYKSKEPIFDAFNIEQELQNSIEKKVWLKNGGYLFIEHTEALVSIDVNSGKYFGKKDHEAHSLKINLEAAREIARQVRLRDIGGLIVIDFIDMQEEANKEKIVNELKKEFSKDKATTKIADVSPFGLIEMTRQRIRPSLIHNISDPCPYCHGVGLIPTKGTVVSKLEMWIRRYKAGDFDRRIILKVHPEMYDYLTKGHFSRIFRLMWKYWIKISLEIDDHLKVHEFRIYSRKKHEDIIEKFI
ncbi:MAG: Rne/Rng family ribonuclease [Calditrichia bacterium]